MTTCEVVGNFHVHTEHSDGTGSYEQVAQAAACAGLDVVMVTDHNTMGPGAEHWYTHPQNGRRVLLLMGEEVHDPGLSPPGNHYLALGVDQPVHHLAAQPQALIDAVTRAGGVGFIAHPVEEPAALIGIPAFPWRNWGVSGYAGIELWNYLSEFKSFVSSRRRALAAIYKPDWFIRGPFPKTLALWDHLLADGQQVVAIGGADAHASVYPIGPARRRVFPYEHMFRAVNTHLLLRTPLAEDTAVAKQQVLHALRLGYAFVAYERLGDGRGFRFEAASHRAKAGMGDTISLDGLVTLRAVTPLTARIRLLHDGREVAQVWGQALRHQTSAPGVYRVEAHRRHGLRERGWLFSNPIYVFE